MRSCPSIAERRRGFTLIEVMVALLILSVMAVMAWRGLDSIIRSREIADGSVKRTLRVQGVMTQWQADINSVFDTGAVEAIAWDGAALRLTRRSAGGVQVVVWALRSGRLVRWAGPPVTTLGPLQEQWTRSFPFVGREPGSVPALKDVTHFQVVYWRGGYLTNAQSSAGAPTPATAPPPGGLQPPVPPSRPALPDGVHSIITLGGAAGMSGTITRDVSL